MKKLIIVLALCLSYVLLSCAKLNDDLSAPIEVDTDYLNQQIKLLPVKQLNTFKIGEPVGLQLLYNSENEIVFPSNFNLRIFVRREDNWVEIEERATQRFPDGDVVLSPVNPASYAQIVTFFPELEYLNETYTLRVYVFGDMRIGNHETKQVAAFVDIVLSP